MSHVDEEDNTRLLATYQALLAYKPTSAITCPYPHLGCERDVTIAQNVGTCPCELRKPLYLGDSRERLSTIKKQTNKRAKLLFTSPPYHGVTNYFYDQWLRLWLLGGPSQPRSPGEECKRKFENKQDYVEMLRNVFAKSIPLLSPSAVVCVRTDSRKFTREATIEALETAFPRKKLRSQKHSRPDFTQTALFDSKLEAEAEVDFVMW